MKISAGYLDDAILKIGQNNETKTILLEALRRIDQILKMPDFDVREQVTGPVIDAMHMPNQEITKTLKDGTTIEARYASKIARDFVLAPDLPDHVWEPQTTRTLIRFAPGAKHVIVGGAYIGDQAILIAKAMSAGGVVHCFEPSVASAELLRRNAINNQLHNIVVNQLGLWSSDHIRLKLVGEDSHASSEIASNEQLGSFPTTSINQYSKDAALEFLDLILLDIEGAEMEALRGASQFISQSPDHAPILLFEIHQSYSDWSNGLQNTEIVKYLISNNYHVFALRDYNSNVEMIGQPIELVELDGIWLEGPPHGFNMLATKRVSDIETYGFRVVTGVSPKLLFHRDPTIHAPLP